MGIFNRLFNFAGKKPVAAEGFAAKETPPKRKINAFPLEEMRTPSGLLDDASDLVIFDTDNFEQVELPDLGDDFDSDSPDLGGDGDGEFSLEVAANNSEVDEELLTDNPDDFEDVPFIDSDNILNDGTDADELEFEDVPFADGDDLTLDDDGGDGDDGEIVPIALETPSPVFESGVFTVGDSGQVQIDFKFDGGKYEGELAIFSLDGMDQFDPGSHDFIQEAASRALSDSVLGHVVISDRTEGARFFGELGESDWNAGEYLGVKTFEMRSGDEFGFMLIPNSTVQEVFDNPDIEGAGRPLFSLATANPNDAFHVGQIADVTGDGTTFVMEDLRVDTGSDHDYNDLIFRVSGATGKVVLMDGLIDPAHDWRTTELGQQIAFNVESHIAPGKELPEDPIHPALPEPTVPQTNVDQGGNGFSELTLPHDEIVEPNQGGALPNTPTSIKASLTQDIIDQVSNIDPTDVYQVSSHQLTDTEISVLSGNTSVSILTPEGQLLSQQVLTRGTHSLTVPDNVSGKVLLKFDSQNSSNATYILRGFESKAPEPFNIDVQFESGVTASQQAVIQAAARSVESLIGQGLPSAIVDGKIIDDVNFKIAVTNLDGAGGTLAQTKIDFMRYGTLLPAQSITQFDVNDIAQLEESGQLFSVVQHEILHGLGFGNLWEAKGLVDYAGTPLAQYNGEHGVAAFKEVGGLTDAIPLETDGEGSAGLHWHEALFQDEVMTRDLGFETGENGQVTSPISAVTLAALVDLGYQVNLDKSTPGWGLFGGRQLKEEDLTEEQIEAFRKLAEESFDQPDDEFIYAVMPEVDPAKVAPEIWAHAERFWKNGEYYDWVDYQIVSGNTLSQIALDRMGSAHPDYYWWIANRNGIPNPDYIVAGNWIEVPQWHPNYEWEQEQERLRREAELQRQQEEEERRRQEEEERLNNDQAEQERKRREEEERQRQAEAQQRELEEQERRLREEQERRRQQEEYEREQARLRELERQREIARQKGKGGQDWFFAKPLPEFGPVDPFETKLTGETVGNLVPDDYYRFTLSRAGRIDARLMKLLADADLVLYDVRNRPISYSMREGITDEQILVDLIPGTYLLRVNSPKGVTTDYELIVKFKHLLSQSEIGPPPGWRVGGGNGGGGGTTGPIFADPRIEKIFRQAVEEFAVPERQQARSKVDALRAERDRLEREKKALIESKSAELRGKVHGMLDRVKSEQQGNVNGIANNIKGGIDGVANGAIGAINGLVPDWVFNTPFVGGWLRDRFNQAKGAIEGAINGARNWLNAKVDEVKNTINNAISWFIDRVKDAYFTAGEANIAIEGIAAQFRGMIENATAALNGLIGSFKGMVLGQIEWTRNIGVPGWNLYDNAIVGFANNLTNGIQDTVRDTGRSFMDRVGDAEKGVQWVIAEIGNLLGDETGRIYNQYQDQIRSLNNQIEAITNDTDRRIRAKEAEYQNQLQNFLNQLGNEGKKILDTILNFANSPAGQISIAVIEVIIGITPLGPVLDVKDTAIASYKMWNGDQSLGTKVELLASLAGWFPGLGDALKSVAKVALKGPLDELLKHFGSDVTQQVSKTFKDSKKWKEAFIDLVTKLSKIWQQFDSVIAGSAGWIIDFLPGFKPAFKAISGAIEELMAEAPKIGDELAETSQWIYQKVDNTILMLPKPDDVLLLPSPDEVLLLPGK